MTEVYIEVGPTRTVACSWEWPGWCRYGKTAESAIQSLVDYGPRYGIIAQRAGLSFAPAPPVVTAQLQGGTNTDWAPSLITDRDREPWKLADAERCVHLLRAAWATIDDVLATSSPTLRKGPRGGGREPDEIAQHVLEAERAYARKIGVKHAAFPFTDQTSLAEFRDQIATTLSTPSDGSPLAEGGWPAAYAVRRMAWHVIDHVWEIEDRQM